jgi:ectoine hydroxylase-related dioxygenase (phytanoyl-CoA dioxygenase family)
VPEVFDRHAIAAALSDVDAWRREFLDQMSDDQTQWYLEQADTTGTTLRKLDEPVFHRPIFRQMTQSKGMVAIVEQLIGSGVSIFFSQIFCKPPEVGGPKPVHQDNFYFGPNNLDATLTVWIALDDATVENGCLFYGDGSHRGPVYEHFAPPEEPFNLQISTEKVNDFRMTAAPVPAGGVSFHHGNTWHQSSSNTSSRPRRAVAMHFLQNDASLIDPALWYDPSIVVKIS